eukprot:14364836-Alexandrium_andersonii.AAC.1
MHQHTNAPPDQRTKTPRHRHVHEQGHSNTHQHQHQHANTTPAITRIRLRYPAFFGLAASSLGPALQSPNSEMASLGSSGLPSVLPSDYDSDIEML